MVNKKMFELIHEIAEKKGLEFEEVLNVFGESLASCSKKLVDRKSVV